MPSSKKLFFSKDPFKSIKILAAIRMKNSRSKTDNTKTTTLLLLCKEDDLTSLLITNADCVNEKASCQKVARDILPKNVTIVKNVEVTEDLAREYFEILPTGS